MKNQTLQYYFLTALLLTVLVVVFFIFKPFLYAIIFAVIFAVIFEPFHKRIFNIMPKYPSFAALSTAVLITLIVFIPIYFLSVRIIQEAQVIYHSLVAGDSNISVLDIYKNNIEAIKDKFPIFKNIPTDLRQYLESGLNWLVDNVGSIFSNFIKILSGLFVFVIAFYYILRDGKKLKKSLIFLSPLSDKEDEIIFDKLEMAINSVIKGNLIVVLTQGALVSIGFAIFGVPGAILWGATATVSALIPGIGTALVIVPAIVFLFFQGQIIFALGLFIWGFLAVGLIDNFLGPKLIGRGANLHPLLVLLSVLGGFALFGPVGFIVGPLTLSFLFSLLDIYAYILNTKNP